MPIMCLLYTAPNFSSRSYSIHLLIQQATGYAMCNTVCVMLYALKHKLQYYATGFACICAILNVRAAPLYCKCYAASAMP